MQVARELRSEQLPARLPNKVLINFLRSRSESAKLVEKLKETYRPLICPYDDLLQLITPGSRLFDVGCGRGQFALLAAEFARPVAIGGIEISEPLVGKAKAHLGKYSGQIQLDFQAYDGIHLPPSISGYDTVFMIDVLHHIPPDAQASFLAALHQRMSPGSRLIIKDIDGASPLVFANKLHDLLLAGEIGHELSPKQTLHYAAQAGFSLQSVSRRRTWWYPHYTLVLTKELRLPELA